MSLDPSRFGTAKAIHRRTGRTFYLATRLLPERARRPTYALYAFFRIADEVVDDPDPPSVHAQRRELAAIRAAAVGEREPTDEVLEVFAQVREEYDLDAREIEIFLDCMAMDLEQDRYETVDELAEYLRGSSVAVAYLLLDVFATDLDPAARPHAAALAEAFQLTNFLRDVREDVTQYDRIYLPREVLDRHGVGFEDVESLRYCEGVAAAIRDELERTESLYRDGVAGIRYLPEDVQFGVLLAAVLYADHHRLIRRVGYDTLTNSPSLSMARRLALTARTWYHWRRSGNPDAVFETVSAVPAEPDSSPDGHPTGGETVTAASSVPTGRPARRIASRVRTYLGDGSK